MQGCCKGFLEREVQGKVWAFQIFRRVRLFMLRSLGYFGYTRHRQGVKFLYCRQGFWSALRANYVKIAAMALLVMEG